METVEKTLTAKERVQIELEEAIDKSISWEMRNAMRDQLRHMSDYAICLQHRLAIWGKSDEELRHEVD